MRGQPGGIPAQLLGPRLVQLVQFPGDVMSQHRVGFISRYGSFRNRGSLSCPFTLTVVWPQWSFCLSCCWKWFSLQFSPLACLYRVFPQIKAFGCCHEVFGTQDLLKKAVKEICGIEDVTRKEIKVNPVAVNHFTWLTEAKFRNIDLFPIYREFAKKYYADGYTVGMSENWRNNSFACSNRVKFDLFLKYGYIAAAGDRHLAEFCEGKWYLENPEVVKEWGFGLTTVGWRKKDLEYRNEKSYKLRTGERELKISPSGEEGVSQMRALLGLHTLVTNVNIPNEGQIPNLPIGAVVETNAVFRDDTVTPVMAGEIPQEIYPMVSRICSEQEMLDKAIAARDVEAIFNIFANDPLVTCSMTDARKLFNEMVLNTKKYLSMYDLGNL